MYDKLLTLWSNRCIFVKTLSELPTPEAEQVIGQARRSDPLTNASMLQIELD